MQVNGVTYVCPNKDIVCGDRPENWCDSCGLRAQVPVAPGAAAGIGPTPMRPATNEEMRWLAAGLRRSSTLVYHGPSVADLLEAAGVAAGQGLMVGTTNWAFAMDAQLREIYRRSSAAPGVKGPEHG